MNQHPWIYLTCCVYLTIGAIVSFGFLELFLEGPPDEFAREAAMDKDFQLITSKFKMHPYRVGVAIFLACTFGWPLLLLNGLVTSKPVGKP